MSGNYKLIYLKLHVRLADTMQSIAQFNKGSLIDSG